MLRPFASPAHLLLLTVLVFAAAVPAAAQTAPPTATPEQIAASIGVREAHALAQRGEIQLVDIRRPAEWRQTGIADGAIPLTMHQPLPTFVEKLKVLRERADGKPIAIICAAGVRTARMQRILADNGVSVVNVAPGMTGNWFQRGWIKTGLPIKPAGP